MLQSFSEKGGSRCASFAQDFFWHRAGREIQQSLAILIQITSSDPRCRRTASRCVAHPTRRGQAQRVVNTPWEYRSSYVSRGRRRARGSARTSSAREFSALSHLIPCAPTRSSIPPPSDIPLGRHRFFMAPGGARGLFALPLFWTVLRPSARSHPKRKISSQLPASTGIHRDL